MSVAVDATGTLSDNTTGVTSFNYTGITVGSGSNRALILMVTFSGAGSAAASPTATWDSGGTNQAMTLIGSQTIAVGSAPNNGVLALFGLRNPTSGNKTLAVSWTNSAQYSAAAISFTGVDQTSNAVAFPHFTSTSNTTTPVQLVITSSTGNYTVSAVESGASVSAPTQTQLFLDTNPLSDGGGSYATGAATVTHAWTVSPAASGWGMLGCDIAAAAAAATTIPWFNTVSSDISAFNRAEMIAHD